MSNISSYQISEDIDMSRCLVDIKYLKIFDVLRYRYIKITDI